MNRSRSHTPSEDSECARSAGPDRVPQYTTRGYDWFHRGGHAPGHRPVAIGLGSNLEPRLATLKGAARKLRDTLGQASFSSVYETDPMYQIDQPLFLNACCVGWTDRDPEALLDLLKGLERIAGRKPGDPRFGPRELDLDIELYADEILESERLTIPHPRLPERAFVLLPLSEIAGPWIHPLYGVTIRELAARVDSAGVKATNLHLE